MMEADDINDAVVANLVDNDVPRLPDRPRRVGYTQPAMARMVGAEAVFNLRYVC